jgi:glucosylceramidase
MGSANRRTFLKESAVAAASLTLPVDRLWSLAGRAAPGLRAWITAGEDRFRETSVAPWQPASAISGSIIEIDPSRRFQSILGFGGAFTDASCYLLSRMDSASRQKLLNDLVGRDGLRMSVCRTCIGSSDYSLSAYSFDDTSEPDPDLKQFSINHDQAYILPVLRAAQQTNPDLFLFSAPWSPPGWMKAGGSLLGGSMRSHYFASYAQYFVKFLEGYRNEGVKISAVTSQNEVDTDQDGRMPAALWGQEYEINFVKGFLGPALQRASLDTKIWILDHNYNLSGRVIDELSDPDLFRYVDGVAWHGYYGDASAMTRVHDAFPDKDAYWTEGGPDISDPSYATDWATWAVTFAGILKNWARTIVSWNLVLDENGRPNIGPFQCGGVVTLNSKTGAITQSGQYWAFAHFSKVIERGAYVLGTKGTLSGLDHVAFQNPDGSYVLVIGNQTDARQVQCRIGNNATTLDLPEKSIITLSWT